MYSWKHILRPSVLNGEKLKEVGNPFSLLHGIHESAILGFLDIQVWLSGFAYLGLLVSLYSYSLFLYVHFFWDYTHASCLYRPTIINGLGYSGVQAQLRTGKQSVLFQVCSFWMRMCRSIVPPYVPAVFLTGTSPFGTPSLGLNLDSPGGLLLWSYQITRSSHLDLFATYYHRWTSVYLGYIFECSASGIGYIIAITAADNTTRYIAVFFMAAGMWATACFRVNHWRIECSLTSYPAAPCILWAFTSGCKCLALCAFCPGLSYPITAGVITRRPQQRPCSSQ